MHALRLAAAALAAICAIVAVVSFVAVGCGPNTGEIYVCLNPTTGKLDPNIYDAHHYVGDVFDPCHCYDPCGPSKSCPIVVDAGAPCDAGSDGP
jgi:hypothetical protein